MIWSFVKDYVKHRVTAKSRHRLQSPFVSGLVNEVIYDDTQLPVYSQIEQNKRHMLPNSRRRGNRPKADQLLYRLAKHFKPKHIVEIGTGMGISKLYLTRALPNACITSLEHDGALKHATNKLPPIDFAFVNYYNPAQLLICFELLLPKLKPDSVLIICNVYGDAQAKQNFQVIKMHPKVTATVDLFWLQLVFFKEGMVKEHFRLKF
jgi:predicted O-methyltransferase YrrM